LYAPPLPSQYVGVEGGCDDKTRRVNPPRLPNGVGCGKWGLLVVAGAGRRVDSEQHLVVASGGAYVEVVGRRDSKMDGQYPPQLPAITPQQSKKHEKHAHTFAPALLKPLFGLNERSFIVVTLIGDGSGGSCDRH
jgi:hypothetical protein